MNSVHSSGLQNALPYVGAPEEGAAIDSDADDLASSTHPLRSNTDGDGSRDGDEVLGNADSLNSTLQPGSSTQVPLRASQDYSRIQDAVTWCQPCRVELPALLELSRERWAEGRLDLVAVAVREPWVAIHPFFGGRAPAEVFRERDDNGLSSWGVSTLPDTFLIAPGGRLTLRCSGAREWGSEAARGVILSEMR